MGVASSSKPSDSHKWDQILNNFPDDILFEILLRVPTRDLVKSCVYVCKQWHDTIASRSFWKEKCIQDRIFSQHCWDHLGNRDENYKRLYIKHPYERNLIKNPDASKELSEWQVVYNGGNGWRMETGPIGSDPVSHFSDECKGTIGCWVSSYGKCAKYQVVDLMAAGCSQYVLDHIRPAIHVSEWSVITPILLFEGGLNMQESKLLEHEQQIMERLSDFEARREPPVRDVFMFEDISLAPTPSTSRMPRTPLTSIRMQLLKTIIGDVGFWKMMPTEIFSNDVHDGLKKALDTPILKKSDSVEYAARFDCGAVYKMKVVLLSEKTEEFWSASPKDTNSRYSFKETLPPGRAWFQAKHTFMDYPTGIRYVGFYHEGKDTQFWAGHFGAKMTLASVILDFSCVAGLADTCNGGSKKSE